MDIRIITTCVFRRYITENIPVFFIVFLGLRAVVLGEHFGYSPSRPGAFKYLIVWIDYTTIAVKKNIGRMQTQYRGFGIGSIIQVNRLDKFREPVIFMPGNVQGIA